jgi:hypothetical protein
MAETDRNTLVRTEINRDGSFNLHADGLVKLVVDETRSAIVMALVEELQTASQRGPIDHDGVNLLVKRLAGLRARFMGETLTTVVSFRE